MAFNISQFKSTIDRMGGVAHSSLFEVRISGEILNSVLDNPKDEKRVFTERELTFFCKSVNVPGMALTTMPYEPVGQLPRVFPKKLQNNPVAAIFMVDSDHHVLRFFHRWMQTIVNYGTKSGGEFSEVDGKLPYEVGYKKNYGCRLVIRHYSNESDVEKYYEMIFDRAFPTAIGDLNFAWENNDQYLTLPISFSYDRIEFSGEKTGTSSSRFSRGRSLLDTLGAVAGFADVVEQTFKSGKPRSIQDAINRLTRVRNSFDNISGVSGT